MTIGHVAMNLLPNLGVKNESKLVDLAIGTLLCLHKASQGPLQPQLVPYDFFIVDLHLQAIPCCDPWQNAYSSET